MRWGQSSVRSGHGLVREGCSWCDPDMGWVCRNIAEGFGGTNPEFRHFLVISRRSLNELCDSLRSAQLKNHISAADMAPINALARRLYPALAGLIRHLDTSKQSGRTDPSRRQLP